MFTGLIEEVGVVIGIDLREGGATIDVGCDVVTADAGIGDSIAVNGVCLTVTGLTGLGFTAEMMGETLARTALADAVAGTRVNLERAMAAGDRLGGHMVQGHVDGVARIERIDTLPEWTTVTYSLPRDLLPFVVEKGSITIDGTSLTVMEVGPAPDGAAGVDAWFSVGLIPHTMAVTVHGQRDVGDRVNLEVDVIAKYVQKQVAAHLAALSPTPGTGAPTPGGGRSDDDA